MKKALGFLLGLALIAFLCSGFFSDSVKFFAWLFTLKYSQPETSVVGGIVVRILAFVVSFSTVGAVFGAFGWFNSKLMKVSYSIVSTIVSFATAYVVWQVEKHILIVGIILGLIALLAIVFIIVSVLADKKNGKKAEQNE